MAAGRQRGQLAPFALLTLAAMLIVGVVVDKAGTGGFGDMPHFLEAQPVH